MAQVVLDTAMSLDGFAADVAGRSVYPINELRGSPSLHEMIARTGAVVMGRRAYEMAQGDFTAYEYQVPLFVVTHRQPLKVAKGQNERLSLSFVTEGVRAAIQQARSAAADKQVTVIGGPSIFQQCIALDLADELVLRLIPRMVGTGLPLFANGGTPRALSLLATDESSRQRIDLLYSCR